MDIGILEYWNIGERTGLSGIPFQYSNIPISNILVKVLFLDIASHDGLLALVTEQKVIVCHAIQSRISDHKLIPLIEDLLQQGGWSYADLTHSACVVGPGGFMSLRVACACANTIASQVEIPSVGIHLNDLYGSRVRDRSRSRDGVQEDVLWVHSTKKEELFVCGAGWPEPTLVHLREILLLLPTLTLVGELIPEHEKALEEHGFKRASLLDTLNILPAFLARQQYAEQVLTPWYGRGW